jgi:subtilisin family serine protease
VKALLVLFVISLSFTSVLQAQTAPNKYWVEFTDKNNSPYSVDNPIEFLSQKSIDRRNTQEIDVIEQDIPVNQTYIDGVLALGDIDLLLRSKWLNAITIYLTDESLLDQILSLDYVVQIKSANKYKKGAYETEEAPAYAKANDPEDYGPSFHQLDMLNGYYLHEQELLGQDMLIYVCDGGFDHLNERTAFAHLFENNKIIGTHDFVDGDDFVYESSTHGTSVMGTMAGIIPDELIGTAPQASYFLAITEDVSSEYIIEEDNWIAGAEMADSIGADIMTTSLSYTTFDDPSQDHTYDDLNGQTTRVAIGAGIAAQKGMLIVVSAGNYFAGSWHYIGSPADAFNILAIGAVTSDSSHSNFSSAGPSSDGRVKPEIAAQGTAAVTASAGSDGISFVNGTSFSGPIIAGISSCLWQAFPSATSIQVREAIIQSASQYDNPDDLLGYGIPNYQLAYEILSSATGIKDSVFPGRENSYFQNVSPNPFINDLRILLRSRSGNNERATISLYDETGRIIKQIEIIVTKNQLNEIALNLSDISSGMYSLEYKSESGNEVVKVVKY